MRIAVVGLGNAGSTLHLPALAGISSTSLVGACDPLLERRTAAEQRWSVPTFETFEEMVARTKPELVVIATPPVTHADYCLQSLAAGAHVLCEKPFVTSVEQAYAVIAAARAAGRTVALNHEFREMPIFRAVRDQVGRPDVGSLVFVQAWQLMDLPPWKEPGWRGELLQGTLYEASVHLIDYVMALFGEKPVAVSATMSTCGVRAEESDAVALVTLEFSRGRLAQIVQNRLCPGETQYFEVRADCTNASLRGSFGGRARLSMGLQRSTRPHVRVEYGASGIAWREVGHRRTLLARNPRDPAMIATRLLIERTLAAIASGGALPASAADARDGIEVIAACYEAARSGQRVTLAASSTLLASVPLGSASP
jgi:predicted dehydrogenase